jgi:hypothetical protein
MRHQWRYENEEMSLALLKQGRLKYFYLKFQKKSRIVHPNGIQPLLPTI